MTCCIYKYIYIYLLLNNNNLTSSKYLAVGLDSLYHILHSTANPLALHRCYQHTHSESEEREVGT